MVMVEQAADTWASDPATRSSESGGPKNVNKSECHSNGAFTPEPDPKVYTKIVAPQADKLRLCPSRLHLIQLLPLNH